MKRRETNLVKFIKDECSNFKVCETCLVMDGKRCNHFEKCVLVLDIDYKYRQPGYDYSKLFAQYAQQTKAKVGKVKTRRCGCGEPVEPRQRLCPACRAKNRRKSKRDYQRKFRGFQRISA